MKYLLFSQKHLNNFFEIFVQHLPKILRIKKCLYMGSGGRAPEASEFIKNSHENYARFFNFHRPIYIEIKFKFMAYGKSSENQKEIKKPNYKILCFCTRNQLG